jgi:hypothetical protein
MTAQFFEFVFIALFKKKRGNNELQFALKPIKAAL